MKLFQFFKNLFKVEPIKYNDVPKEVPKKDIVIQENKVDKEKTCNMCGGYSGNYSLCNSCAVIISCG